MTREWKPGDVALYDGLRVMFTGYPDDPDTLRWIDEEGDPRDVQSGIGNGLTFRLLVVIDPEDGDAVSRLRVLYYDHMRSLPQGSPTLNQDAMRAALREFADPKPPKPEEPAGLGAVVEDETGDRWVWLSAGAEGAHWFRVGVPGARRNWHQIPAVRVLSEGVQA